MKIKTVGVALIAGAAGAAAVMVGQGTRLSIVPVNMSFEVWAGILLASVGILLTALGVVVAIAAIWGFSGIKASAETAAVKHVADQVADGLLAPKLKAAFESFLESQLKDDRLRRYMEDRVNTVLYRGPESRAEDDEESFEEEYLDPNDSGDTSDNDAKV